MENREYKFRIIDSIIDEYLETFGAVCIEGPKWCGKTWTSSYHCNSKIMLGDPAGNFWTFHRSIQKRRWRFRSSYHST